MPTVSDILALKFQLDSSGLSAGMESVDRNIGSAKRDLEQQGTDFERTVKGFGYSIETAIKNVGNFFGIVLSFEGFKQLVIDSAQAGTTMGRFAESLGTTVEKTQQYRQAFSSFGGGNTGILETIQEMQLGLTKMSQGLGKPEWAKALERLPGFQGPVLSTDKPEDIMQRAGKAFEQNRITPLAARQYLPGTLTQADILLLTKPAEMQRLLESQKRVGTPTTPQTKAMESLQEGISNVRTASELLSIQTITMAEPFLRELLDFTTKVLSWLRGVRTFVSGSSSPGTGVTLQPLPGRAPGGRENFNRGAVGRQPTGLAQPRPGGVPPVAPSAPGMSTPPPAAEPSPESLLRTRSPTSVPSVPARRTETKAPTTPNATGGSSAVELHRSGAPSAAVDDALKLEGLSERRDRDTIMQYLRTGGAGMDPSTTAWCAAFVNSSLQREGIRGSGSAVATSFLRWGQAATGGPQKGDVLVQSRGHAAGETGGHVGFATGRVRQGPAGTEYEMIAGNTKDSVLRYWISAHSVTVRRALPNVSTGAVPAASSSDADRPVINRNESATHVNQVIVNTHATNAAGIADDVKNEIGKQMTAPVE